MGKTNEAAAAMHYQRGLDAKLSQREEAIREFRRAIALEPGHAKAHQELGWALYGSGGDLQEARSCLERALELEPALSDAHMYLGIVFNRLRRREDSEAHFRMALGIAESPAIAHATFAEEFLWHNDRYGEAEHHFRVALDHDPELVLALRNYARMLACHGRDSEAKQYFDKALALDPDNRFTLRAYNVFLRDLVAEDRSADECLREAISKDPDYTGAIAYLNRRDRGSSQR